MESLALLVVGILVALFMLGVVTIVFSILAWRGKVNRWVAYGFLIPQFLVNIWAAGTQTNMVYFAAIPLLAGSIFMLLPRKR